MNVKSFKAIKPPQELAQQVASVPYDVIDSQGARALAEGNPQSFLHIIRPEIDLDPDTDLYADAVYNKAKENFDRFIEEGWLVQDEEPGLFVYRQIMDGHSQAGIVGTCHVDEYGNNTIKKHEKTLKKKEDDRTRHVKTLMANAGPVFLTYRDDAGISALQEEVMQGEPLFDFMATDGVQHTVWRVPEPTALEQAFAQIQAAYVADGHHRSASAARVGTELREENPHHNGTEPYNFFLCVLFPENQLKVLAYNRVVSDLNGLTTEAFLEAVENSFDVSFSAPDTPESPRHVSMYLDGKWIGLSWKEDLHADPVSRLDVSVLQEKLLGPILGIDDPKTNPRIAFVGGIHGAKKLKEDVDSGKGAVAFSMYPVTVKQIMDVSDAGDIMPPKSTWFEPKLRSGLLVNKLED